jgi:hypothetical protein
VLALAVVGLAGDGGGGIVEEGEHGGMRMSR